MIDYTLGDSQVERLLNLLRDFKPHRTDEIKQRVYGSRYLGSVRISARIYDIKKKGYGIAEAVQDENTPTLYWYQLVSLPKHDIQFKKWKKKCTKRTSKKGKSRGTRAQNTKTSRKRITATRTTVSSKRSTHNNSTCESKRKISRVGKGKSKSNSRRMAAISATTT